MSDPQVVREMARSLSGREARMLLYIYEDEIDEREPGEVAAIKPNWLLNKLVHFGLVEVLPHAALPLVFRDTPESEVVAVICTEFGADVARACGPDDCGPDDDSEP
jgi:hypothetical protein